MLLRRPHFQQRLRRPHPQRLHTLRQQPPPTPVSSPSRRPKPTSTRSLHSVIREGNSTRRATVFHATSAATCLDYHPSSHATASSLPSRVFSVQAESRVPQAPTLHFHCHERV